jgi:hypothetical protein
MPGEDSAHEKGGVEQEGGRFRRTHLVPVPEADSLAPLPFEDFECGFTLTPKVDRTSRITVRQPQEFMRPVSSVTECEKRVRRVPPPAMIRFVEDWIMLGRRHPPGVQAYRVGR